MRGGGIGRGKHRCEELRCGAVQFVILSPKKGQAPGIASWGSVTNGTGMQVFFPGASLEQPVTYISYNRYSGDVIVFCGHLVDLLSTTLMYFGTSLYFHIALWQ